MSRFQIIKKADQPAQPVQQQQYKPAFQKGPNPNFRKGPRVKERAHRINEDILEDQVRLVGEGIEAGLYPIQEALDLAASQELDLVEISNNNNNSICRIVAYDKFLYQLKMKEKEKKKNAKQMEEKEIRLSPNVDTHDFNTKLKHAKDFLEEGNKVKFSMKFKGREVQHWNRGVEMFKNFITELAEIAIVEQQSRLEGKKMFLTVRPKK